MASTLNRRQRRQQAAAARPIVRRAMRASAARAPLDNKKMLDAMWTRRQEWQAEGWSYFYEVPEITFAVLYQGNVMAKARWFVGWRNPDDPEADPIPVDDDDCPIDGALKKAATDELARLRGPLGGLTEIVRELNMNLEIAGEAFLVGFGAWDEPQKDGEPIRHPEEWDIKSVSEVEKTGDDIKIKNDPGDTKMRALNKERDTIIRIWLRDPQFSMLPHCNMRGVLSECEGLVILSNLVKAEANSRMSAGYFTLPNELGQGPDDGAPDGASEDGAEAQRDPLMEQLFLGATLPVEDPTSASAVAPTFIRGDAAYLGPEVLRHITIARDTTKDIDQRIEARVLRIARGLNLPVEVIKGHMETTFANASQISEDEYSKYFQPRLVLVADAFTVGFLHPQLLDAVDPATNGQRVRFQQEQVDQLCVWYDPSDIVKQSDPVAKSTEGVNLGLLGGESWRRLNGYSEDDAPAPEELLIRAVLGLKVFDSGTSTALLELLGVPLDIQAPAASASALPVAASAMIEAVARARGKGEAVTRDLLLGAAFPTNGTTLAALPSPAKVQRNPGYALMQIDRDLRARLHVAANAAMDRVLERAGNRLRNKAPSELRAALKDLEPKQVGLAYGRRLSAAAGLTDDDLIPGSAWDALEEQFMAWGANAQSRAVAVAKKIVSLTDEAATAIAAKQPEHLADAWTWMKDTLHDLAIARVYNPDPLAPDIGEFDPTARVPTGLVREAVARAGGASSLVQVQGDNPYVVVNNSEPPGGIATGELVMGTIQEEGALVEAYEWVYGPAYRLHVFEPHESLDQEVFAEFESDVLLSAGEFDAYYYPGDHAGCCLPGTVVSGASPSGLSLRWYEGPVVELTTAAGEQLSVTPNHPILTDRGWVRAEALVEGDHVVRCVDGERAADLIPDDYEGPAAVEDLFAARWVAPNVVAGGVPVATEDFDGDGFAGQVCVVLADGDLMPDGHTETAKPTGQPDLARARRVSARLATAGAPFEGLDRVGDATDSRVRSGRYLTTSLGCPPGVDDEVLVVDGTWLDSALGELVGDDAPVHAEALGESLDGLAGAVELDKLIEVDRSRSFSGHVFNLHNDVQWYVAGGIVIHNCACDWAPVIVAPEDLEDVQ